MDDVNNNTITRVWSTDGTEFTTMLVVLAYQPNRFKELSFLSHEFWFVLFVCFAWIVGLISLTGLAGNSIVVSIIVSSRRHGQRSPVQLFLLHLAISDLLVCILNIPLTIWVNFNYPEEEQAAGDGVCKLTRFVQFLAPSSSICLLTVISIDRYFSLARPLQAPKSWLRPKILITVGWIYASAIFLPTFYFVKQEKIQFENKTLWYCGAIPNNTRPGFFYLLFLLVFGFTAQLIIMTVLYCRVGKAVWSRSKNIMLSCRITKGNVASLVRTKRRVTRMLITVLMFFLVSWAPFVIYSGFVERWVAPFPNPSDPIRIISYGLGLFNSVCNPFIYVFNSPSFRKESLRVVCLEASDGGTKPNLSTTRRTTKSFVAGSLGTKARLKHLTMLKSEIGKNNEVFEYGGDTRL